MDTFHDLLNNPRHSAVRIVIGETQLSVESWILRVAANEDINDDVKFWWRTMRDHAHVVTLVNEMGVWKVLG